MFLVLGLGLLIVIVVAVVVAAVTAVICSRVPELEEDNFY